ncbi:MAG: uracil-DNA glycosylase [Actinomycetota bacterium]
MSSLLEQESEKEYWACLRKCIEQERSCYPNRVFPPEDKELEALRLTLCRKTRVVIIGQDPYHSPGLADGLAFSVPRDASKLPPSLRNILRALREDPDLPDDARSIDLIPTNLAVWAQRECVLLLNTTLTVRQGVAGSHRGMGWETFTDRVIQEVQREAQPAFMLWGRKAQRKRKLLVDTPPAMITESPHPRMPTFPESRPFSQVNKSLDAAGLPKIDWRLAD